MSIISHLRQITGRSIGSCLCFIVVLLFAQIVQAQDPDSSEHPLRNKYIRSELTVEQGLPDNVVNAIAQTENGLLWIGTGTGLASFDGVTFHPLRLKVEGSASAGAVNALLRASNGDLWVGTDAGATVLPKAAQDHIDSGTLKLLRTAAGVSEDAQVIFETRNRDILVGGKHGLYLYSEKILLPVLENVYVNRISQAADGHLYIVTSDGLIEIAGRNRVPATVTAKQLGVQIDQVFEVHQGSDGTVWYGTHVGIRRQSNGLVSSLTPSQVGNTATNHIYEDPQGHIWVGTGIGLYLVTGDRLENLDTLNLPPVDLCHGLWRCLVRNEWKWTLALQTTGDPRLYQEGWVAERSTDGSSCAS